MTGTDLTKFIAPSVGVDQDYDAEKGVNELVALKSSTSRFLAVEAGTHLSYASVTPSANGKKYDIDWALGPFKVKLGLDVDTLTLYVYVSVKVPILGNVKLVEIKGNLNDGVTASFSIAVASGSFTFYLKSKNQLWVRVEVSAFSIGYKGDYKIFTF